MSQVQSQNDSNSFMELPDLKEGFKDRLLARRHQLEMELLSVQQELGQARSMDKSMERPTPN